MNRHPARYTICFALVLALGLAGFCWTNGRHRGGGSGTERVPI
ncbi:MAG: hypothetical protein KatS3mg110_0123 [Pirellulaceae bacterium]|nr:MAG: hypothetical protein KatS3mg110_0123 [Pirellulaceae bacterium]